MWIGCFVGVTSPLDSFAPISYRCIDDHPDGQPNKSYVRTTFESCHWIKPLPEKGSDWVRYIWFVSAAELPPFPGPHPLRSHSLSLLFLSPTTITTPASLACSLQCADPGGWIPKKTTNNAQASTLLAEVEGVRKATALKK